MKRINVLAATLLSAASISGCSMGAKNFSCPGVPGGVTCMSVLDVYEKTGNGGSVSGPDNSAAAANVAHGHGQIGGHRPANAAVVPDRPVPIRTEPEVLRILIAPWEDEQENLFGGGYVFTELAKRKWNIGVRNPMRDTHTLDSFFGQISTD